LIIILNIFQFIVKKSPFYKITADSSLFWPHFEIFVDKVGAPRTTVSQGLGKKITSAETQDTGELPPSRQKQTWTP